MNLHQLLFNGPHTCPWWFGYTFDNPLRRLIHDPAQLFAGLIREGDTVVDVGCGLGHFTVGMAELVGPRGKVIAVDLQDAMLRRARRRVERSGYADRVEFVQCRTDTLGIPGKADFVLAFWMVHEVRQPRRFLSEIAAVLRPAGRFFIAEPKIHVSEALFARNVQFAREAGFEIVEAPPVRLSRAVICRPASRTLQSQ